MVDEMLCGLWSDPVRRKADLKGRTTGYRERRGGSDLPPGSLAISLRTVAREKRRSSEEEKKLDEERNEDGSRAVWWGGEGTDGGQPFGSRVWDRDRHSKAYRNINNDMGVVFQRYRMRYCYFTLPHLPYSP